MTDPNKVLDYYNSFPERDRLDSPAGRLEFMLSLRLLDAHLSPDCRILDLGGGPGRYTAELARRGHEVVLAEPSPALLAEGKERVREAGLDSRVVGYTDANALDLSEFGDGTFDAIVCFGPFYHLTSAEERSIAAGECHRVLAEQGLLFAAYIPWLTGISHLIWRAAHCASQLSARTFDTAFREGIFRNETGAGFQEGYYARPDEMESLFEHAGFATIDHAAVQGIASEREEELFDIEHRDPDLYRKVMDCITESARQRAILESGGHNILVGRKCAP